jgi:hypothetical protein
MQNLFWLKSCTFLKGVAAMEEDKIIPEISVTSYMLKKSHISRWYFYIVYFPIFMIVFSFFGFLWAIILGTIITFILFGLFLGWRNSFSSHYPYNCPSCGYNMSIILTDKESKLTDAKYQGRCPMCTKYHVVDYRYDGNMKILKD